MSNVLHTEGVNFDIRDLRRICGYYGYESIFLVFEEPFSFEINPENHLLKEYRTLYNELCEDNPNKVQPHMEIKDVYLHIFT